MTLPTNNEKQRRSCLTSTPYRCREVFADRCGLFSNVIWIDHQESLPLVAQDPTCSTPRGLSSFGPAASRSPPPRRRWCPARRRWRGPAPAGSTRVSYRPYPPARSVPSFSAGGRPPRCSAPTRVRYLGPAVLLPPPTCARGLPHHAGSYPSTDPLCESPPWRASLALDGVPSVSWRAICRYGGVCSLLAFFCATYRYPTCG